MSRKHHVKKSGSSSRYPDRLRARGETTATVRMPFLSAAGKRYETAADWLAATQRRSQHSAA